ncbi:MAG: ATP-binding protein [Pseudolysinimonas sp.]
MTSPEPSMKVMFDGSLSYIDRVHEAFDDLWRRYPGIAAVDRMAFETALIELTTNVISAAQGDVAVDGELRVVVGVAELSAEIVDHGEEFRGYLDHFALPAQSAESGRGMAVIDSLTDSFEYQRIPVQNSWTPAENHWKIVRVLTVPLTTLPPST